MDISNGPLFLISVDVEGTDVEGGRFFGFVVGVGFGRGVGNATCGAQGDAVDFWGFGEGGEGAEKDEKRDAREGEFAEQGHWSRAEGLHAWKVAERPGWRSDGRYRAMIMR